MAVVLLAPTVLGLGFWLLSNISRVVTHEAVDAVVVDLIPTIDSDGDTLYRPIYEYRVDGVTYRYESMVNLGGVVVPDLGERKTLLYNPDQPGRWFSWPSRSSCSLRCSGQCCGEAASRRLMSPAGVLTPYRRGHRRRRRLLIVTAPQGKAN